MRFIISLSIILACQAASAKVLFSCEATSPKEMGGQTLHYKLSENDGKLKLEHNGLAIEDEVSASSVNLSQLQEFLKCDAYDEACIEKTTLKNKAYQELGNMIAIGKDAPPDMQNFYQTNKLDVSKIARGQSYLFGKETKMGRPGIFEYYDKNNKLLGRYVFALGTFDCKNKSKPTQDLSVIFKDLGIEPPSFPSEKGMGK